MTIEPATAHPRGTVTFLFTDIEGSTRLWEHHRDAMASALARHDEIVRRAIEGAGGSVFSTGGDGVAAAFPRAPDAVRAAVDAQAGLQAASWDPPLAVRMALHTGDVEARGGDYFGPPLNRCARLMATAHGGQVLCSGVTASLVSDQLPEGCRLRDLGPHRLRDLSEPEHVFQVEHASLLAEFPPLRSMDSFSGNLPTQPTSFVGREAEVTEIAKALDQARLVTLSGVGGVGKTRLALQVAAHVLPSFSDGAWLVELASVGSAEAVEETVASVLGVQPGPGRALEQGVLDFLRAKTLLLVVDNCEHLLGPVARFVDTALRAAPGLTVLATSREGLAMSGERLFTVRSLETPDAAMAVDDLVVTEAVRLFANRAREAHSDFDLSSENALKVGELCRRLDGIPLAIELAAARIRVMTPKEILDHLDRRFKLLTTGRRTAVTRHQTLQSTLDWSYDLLEPAERAAFRRLSVFSGDFELASAEAIAAAEDLDAFEVADLVFKLVEKSLVIAQSDGDVTRYLLLETIRDYAWDRLVEDGESEAVSARHCYYYVALAEEQSPRLCGREEMAARAIIERELDNLRVALRWAIDAGEADSALRLVDALCNIGSLRTPFGILSLEAARMDGAERHPLAAVALAAAAAAYSAQGENRLALELTDTAIQAAYATRGTPLGDRALCHAFANVAMVSYALSDVQRFLTIGNDWLAAARAIDDRFEISQALNIVGSLVADPTEGQRACEEALAIAHELGSPSRISYASISLGGRLTELDTDRAEVVFAQAFEFARIARNDWLDNFAASQLAILQAEKGNMLGATRSLVGVAERSANAGDHFAASVAITHLALVFADMGDERSALLLGAWIDGHGGYDRTNPSFATRKNAYEALVRSQTPSEWERLTEEAGALDAQQVVALARQTVDAMTEGA